MEVIEKTISYSRILSTKDKIFQLLAKYGRLQTKDISQSLRVSASVIRSRLSENKKLFRHFEDGWGIISSLESTTKSQPIIELPEPEIKYQPYPDFQIKPFKPAKSSRDEEDIGINLADLHIGKVTGSYSVEIAKQRMEHLLDGVMSIINLHRPIKRAWVFDLGDNVQGENPHQGSKVGDTECGAYEQIHTHAIPMLSHFLCSLAQGVETVEFYGVDGNHGIYDKAAPTKTNWDGFVYSGLELALTNQKSIHIHSPTQFYQLVNIRGFRFFLIHGNQVFAQQGIPLFAMRRKMQEWYAYVGGFNYAYTGHFHSEARDQVNSVADYTICPPMVTGDSWALEKIGRASKPVQLCFGVHNKYGRTFEYRLYCDTEFLPEKYEETP